MVGTLKTPSSPGSLGDQALDDLLTALRNGHLRAGAFFSMPELVDILGFPIAAIREATKRAETQSLLKILPKRGVTVMDASPQITFHCMDMRATFDKEGARRMLAKSDRPALGEIRNKHIELRSRAQQNVTPQMRAEAIAVDLSLHDALAAELENPFLMQCYAENSNRIAIIQNSRAFLPDRIVPAMEEHLEIIEALKTGDEPRTLAALDVHLSQTLRWWGV